MRANAGLVITGERVTLVPYEKEHVAKYHNWMTDPWLQEMTASEPLTEEEEYEMQRSWREDDKKCTFIVLENAESDGKPGSSFTNESAIARMAGDVNLFFNDYEDPHACEMEIMIAEEKYRRKGYALEAVKLMMAYATSELSVSRFYCKIGDANEASLRLFQKLGYTKCNYAAAFKEVELELLPKTKRSEVVDDVLKYATIHPAQGAH